MTQDQDVPGNEAWHEQGSFGPDRNDAVSATMEKARTTQLPWVATAQTGWAAKRATQRALADCHHCGVELANCEGCGDLRCLKCEPYLSDDCRWTI